MDSPPIERIRSLCRKGPEHKAEPSHQQRYLISVVPGLSPGSSSDRCYFRMADIHDRACFAETTASASMGPCLACSVLFSRAGRKFSSTLRSGRSRRQSILECNTSSVPGQLIITTSYTSSSGKTNSILAPRTDKTSIAFAPPSGERTLIRLLSNCLSSPSRFMFTRTFLRGVL